MGTGMEQIGDPDSKSRFSACSESHSTCERDPDLRPLFRSQNLDGLSLRDLKTTCDLGTYPPIQKQTLSQGNPNYLQKLLKTYYQSRSIGGAKTGPSTPIPAASCSVGQALLKPQFPFLRHTDGNTMALQEKL